MPRSTVPEEVLHAVVATPEMWPAILEWRAWFTDARTGRVEITFGNGGVKDMQRYERLALGAGVDLPEGMVAICPTCQGVMTDRDYGNKVYCGRCDETRTVWEIKRQHSYRPARAGETAREPVNGIARPQP